MKILKQLYLYLLPAACLIAGMTSSCSDEYNEGLTATTNPHYLNADKSSLSFSSSGGSQQLGITCIGTSWSLSGNAAWISLNETSGSANATVGVTVSENTDFSDKGRASTLSLAGSGVSSRTITVNQEAPSLALTVSPSSVELDAAEGSSASITVACNNAWDVNIADNSWLTANKTSDGVTISAKENATGSSRTNTVSVSSGSKIETVKVTQKAANITPSLESLSFTHASSTKSISIKSDVSWTIKTNTSWLDITPLSGSAGTTNVNVAVTQNTSKDSRTGSFTIGSSEVIVTQEGVSLSASPTSLTFAEAGESLPLSITSNTTWRLTSTSDDISFSKSQGDGNATVTVTMGENTGTVKREIITLQTTDGSSQSLQISVSQSGSGITPINSLDTFAKEGGSIVYSVPSLSNWVAEVPSECSSWIHISPSKGSKDEAMTITVDKTTDLNDRSGYITLTYDYGAKYRIIINQYGAGIITSMSSCQFFAKGGDSEPITVQSLGDVTASASASWLAAKLNGNLLTITAAENLTGTVRNGVVTLKLAGKEHKVDISVTQASQHGVFVVNDYGNDTNLVPDIVIDITGIQAGGYGDDEDAGLEAVDLGLSVKWATKNIGALRPEDYGGNYAWGETEPKDYYYMSNYKWCNGSYNTLTKYCTDSQYGIVDNKTVLDPKDDVAHVKWGGSWRMPTKTEFDELLTQCTWTWTIQNGVNGYRVTSKTNGKSIFLPAAGSRSCWSSSLDDSNSNYACNLYFNSSNVLWLSNSRCSGQSVRPVCP